MKILEYEYEDSREDGWKFDRVKLGKINLFVGDSATGKSRLLNTMFDLGRFAISKEFAIGSWKVVFEHSNSTYTWTIRTENRTSAKQPGIVVSEELWKHDGDQRQQLVKRDGTSFIYTDKQAPKLSQQETSISLLREEEFMRPVHTAFSSIERRLFDKSALEKAAAYQSVPANIVDAMKENSQDLRALFERDMTLSANLFVLSKYRPNMYEQIIENYKRVFPFIKETRLAEYDEIAPNAPMGGQIPVFTIRERTTKNWIPLTQFSSGMLKVLLILTDIFILPNEGVYIIDEYENSLGISAIDFFPQFVLELDKDVQFIITSHHPYIINAIPLANWYVFHRKAVNVSIRQGEELSQKYGKSKQQAFVQLINDPFFKTGVE